MGCLLKADQVPSVRSPVLLPNGMERFIVAACHSNFFCGRLPLGFGLCCFGCSIRGGHYLSTLPSLLLAAGSSVPCLGSVGPLIPFIPHKTPSLWRRNRPIARSGFHLRARIPSPSSWHFAASPIGGRRICFPEGKSAFTRNIESVFLIR